jgi:hypothetical protein
MSELTRQIESLFDDEFEIPDVANPDAISRIVGRYNQGKDVALNHHKDTIDGVCIALAIRWLAHKSTGDNFWKGCIKGKNALNAESVAFVQKVMSALVAAHGGHHRMDIVKETAHSSGLTPFVPPANSGPVWSGGECGVSGAGVIKELWMHRSHAIVALRPEHGKPGDGHALGFASGPQASWLFDPNFGEISLTNAQLATSVFAALWKKRGYGLLANFDITRYHPSLKK